MLMKLRIRAARIYVINKELFNLILMVLAHFKETRILV